MSVEAFCEDHGPYDASLRSCPNCASPERSSDNEATDAGFYGDETGPTLPPGYANEDEGSEPATDIPAKRVGRDFLDVEDGVETEVGPEKRKGRDETELEFAPSSTLGMLWVLEGRRRGYFYPIKHGTVVGREEGDLILEDSKVSSSHAKFTVEDDQFIIWDFGSSNGTYVNGERIRGATTLQENDQVKIGDTVFVAKFLLSKPKRKVESPARKKKPGSAKKKSPK